MNAQAVSSRSAEVRDLDDTRVVKLFPSGWPKAAANREARAARLAHAAGLPTPAIHGIVEQSGRTGIVFDRCKGLNLLDALIESPHTVNQCATVMAELHARVHRCNALDLPAVDERLSHSINRAAVLGTRDKSRILALLKNIPVADTLCHGDFHPGQIIESGRGPQVIDWFDAVRGDPTYDVAKTLLLIRHAFVPGRGGQELALVRETLAVGYLDEYLKRNSIALDKLHDWTLIIAGARLANDLPEPEKIAMTTIVGTDHGHRAPREYGGPT